MARDDTAPSSCTTLLYRVEVKRPKPHPRKETEKSTGSTPFRPRGSPARRTARDPGRNERTLATTSRSSPEFLPAQSCLRLCVSLLSLSFCQSLGRSQRLRGVERARLPLVLAAAVVCPVNFPFCALSLSLSVCAFCHPSRQGLALVDSLRVLYPATR